ncbi:hypothetical protein BJY00DRAFT_291330 [Aspergillus carlsbadensis]|nr:hypothetical protein BJY00DRAFT_291330 [Aspergillus carlsbadensis]
MDEPRKLMAALAEETRSWKDVRNTLGPPVALYLVTAVLRVGDRIRTASSYAVPVLISAIIAQGYLFRRERRWGYYTATRTQARAGLTVHFLGYSR